MTQGKLLQDAWHLFTFDSRGWSSTLKVLLNQSRTWHS